MRQPCLERGPRPSCEGLRERTCSLFVDPCCETSSEADHVAYLDNTLPVLLCRASCSLAALFVDCALAFPCRSLVAFFLSSCGGLTGPISPKCLLVFCLASENNGATDIFCMEVNRSFFPIPSGPHARALHHIPQGSRKGRRKNPPKTHIVFQQRRTAPTRPPIKRMFHKSSCSQTRPLQNGRVCLQHQEGDSALMLNTDKAPTKALTYNHGPM